MQCIHIHQRAKGPRPLSTAIDKRKLYQLKVEHGTFTSLVFSATGGVGVKRWTCTQDWPRWLLRRKFVSYVKTISWI